MSKDNGKKVSRFFLVIFTHGKGTGNISLETTTGKYLNYEVVAGIIKKAFPQITSVITVINIIEISPEDHAEWVRRSSIIKPTISWKLVN